LSHGTKVASVLDEEEMVECQQCVLGPMDGCVYWDAKKYHLCFFWNSSLSSVRDECVTSLWQISWLTLIWLFSLLSKNNAAIITQ
jgi:hypothetical protein